MKTFKRLILFAFVICSTTTVISPTKSFTAEFDDYVAITLGYIKPFNEGNAQKLNSFYNEDLVIVGLAGIQDTLSKRST
jgi:hypothetical protein